MRAAALRQVPLFATLPAEEVSYLAETLEPVQVTQGSLLFREGDIGGCCYFILEGEVEILKALGTPDERLLAIRGPGTPLGEMGLFSQDHTRTASVRARVPVLVLAMQRDDLENLLHRQPTLAFKLVQTLSRRLDESETHTIQDLREKNRLLQAAYDELKAAQAQIIEKEKLEQELEVARRIQRSMLPHELPKDQRYRFGVQFEPMSAVGGDFYDVIPLGEGAMGVAVGDVAGHGVPAALFMALTATLLRAEAIRAPTPESALQAVNWQLAERNETGIFVTLLYGVLRPADPAFRYARAGHPLPILIDSAGSVVALEQRVGQPLGFLDQVELDQGSLSLEPGSTMLLYTDGISEAANDSGELYGEGRLVEAVKSATGNQAQEICKQLLAAVRSFQGSAPQEDDFTLLAVQTG